MWEPLGEHFPHAHAVGGVTKEFAYMQDQPNVLPHTGQVFHHAMIAAVQVGCGLLTEWTQRIR